MIRTATQLKAKVRNLSGGDSTKAQTLIRNFIMERFLERIALSQYRNNFILKGGMLVSAVVGLDTRATMDIDTTVKSLELSKENAVKIFEEIIAVEIPDAFLLNMSKDVIAFISPVCNKHSFHFTLISVDHLTNCLVFVFQTSRLYNCIRISSGPQIIQSIEMDLVKAFCTRQGLKIGCFIFRVVGDTKVRPVAGQQPISANQFFFACNTCKLMKNIFKSLWQYLSPTLIEGRIGRGVRTIIKVLQEFVFYRFLFHGYEKSQSLSK